jgi:hypothetical protein
VGNRRKTAANARWLMVPPIVALLFPSPSNANAHYTKQQVVSYSKALDVAKLDPTLTSQRLDQWLQSGPAHVEKVTWETSDCDLMPPPDPKYVAPLCVKVRFTRRNAGGWILIKVGTFRDGISGAPHLESMLTGSANGLVFDSSKLSDLPRALDEASSLKPR